MPEAWGLGTCGRGRDRGGSLVPLWTPSGALGGQWLEPTPAGGVSLGSWV